MSISRRALLWGLLAVILGAGITFWRDPGWNRIRHWKQIRAGNELVKKVEEFKHTHGRLPSSLAEMGLKDTESGPLYYRRVSDTEYVIWFGLGVGESLEFDSRQGTWR